MLTIHDNEFKKYGQVLNINTDAVVEFLAKIPLSLSGNQYVASDKELEKLLIVRELRNMYYGEEIEAGYCNGHNEMLNCGEYHGCPEINIAADDCTLFLATLDQVKNGKINSMDFEEVFIKKGEAILMYPGTIHFSPCVVKQNGFHMAVILTKGTNTPLVEKNTDNKLWQVNKWLIAHKDTKQANMGAYVGIEGENRCGGMAR